MKTQIKLGKYLMGISIMSILACNTESVEEPVNDLTEFYSLDAGGEKVTDQVTLDLITSLEIDAGSVKTKVFINPDGTSEERIVIGGDIALTLAELLELKNNVDNARQYSTFNLVSSANRSIDILGFTGGNQALSTKAQNGLRNAVNNYNRLSGSTLRFTLTFGSSQTAINNADMVVFDDTVNNTGNTGGLAGFPSSSGLPNKFVRIFNLESFTTDVNEHVITHEIGHSIGLRHTDWFDRLSCPASIRGNEGEGTIGAVQIPGTPSGRDLTSIMQACFPSNSNGEFNSNDVIAVETIY
ncbi:MAG: peptidase M10 [Flavobacterium sp.]|nr:peptidase M10 [Flavobacterium sp.]